MAGSNTWTYSIVFSAVLLIAFSLRMFDGFTGIVAVTILSSWIGLELLYSYFAQGID